MKHVFSFQSYRVPVILFCLQFFFFYFLSLVNIKIYFKTGNFPGTMLFSFASGFESGLCTFSVPILGANAHMHTFLIVM